MMEQKEPRRAELLLVQGLVAAFFIGTFSHFGHYLLAVERSGDNTDYIAIARSIRQFCGRNAEVILGHVLCNRCFFRTFPDTGTYFPAAALGDLLPGCALVRARSLGRMGRGILHGAEF
jgi:hypothetical protein